MQKNLRWKFLFIIALMVVSLVLFVSPRDWNMRSGWFSRINLGLDIKGGMHLVLQVVTADALNQELAQDADRMANDMRERKIAFDSAKRGNGLAIEIAGVSPAQTKDAYDNLNQLYARKYTINSQIAGGKTDYTLTMMASIVHDMQESTVKQALETIDRRVNALGVTEPTLQIYGGGGSQVPDQIIVELPGIDDFDRVKGLLQETAQLILCMVKKDNGGPYSSIEAAVQASGGKIPDGYKIMPYTDERTEQGGITYLVANSHTDDHRQGFEKRTPRYR